MPPTINKGLLKRLRRAGEIRRRKEDQLVARLLLCYRSGRLPKSGVTMCIEYLHDDLPDYLRTELRWLKYVEIHSDDQEWSLDGVPQGDALRLIEWIAGPSDNYSPPWKLVAEWWYNSVVKLVRTEVALRIAAAESMEGAGI